MLTRVASTCPTSRPDSDYLERVVVSEGRCLADVPRGKRAALFEDFAEDRRETFLRAPLRLGGDGRSSGHRFEASLLPHEQTGPSGSTQICPISPAHPWLPRCRCPSAMMPPPMRAYLDEEHVVFAFA